MGNNRGTGFIVCLLERMKNSRILAVEDIEGKGYFKRLSAAYEVQVTLERDPEMLLLVRPENKGMDEDKIFALERLTQVTYTDQEMVERLNEGSTQKVQQAAHEYACITQNQNQALH